MLTRKHYLNGECSHRDYYGQFVPASYPAAVARYIGHELLLNSADENLNDISLATWDDCPLPLVANALRDCGDYLTAAGRVCIAKEAARQWIETARGA